MTRNRTGVPVAKKSSRLSGLLLWAATAAVVPATVAPTEIAAQSSRSEKVYQRSLQHARAAVSREERKKLTFALLSEIETAIAADDYRLATRLANLAGSVAQKSRNSHAVLLAASKKERVKLLSRQFGDIEDALKQLRSNPGDAEACLTVGRFACLLKNQWKAGLPLLARSGEPRWQRVAALERRNPKDRRGQILLGNAWRDLAGDAEPPYRRPIELRAYHWYQQALKQSAGEQEKRQVRALMARLAVQYLTDLDELKVEPGPWPLGKYGDVGAGRPITINEMEFSNGLGLHSPDRGYAAVRYRLDGRYETFVSGVGISDHKVRIGGRALFLVLGDGKVLWKSPPIGALGEVQYCRVKIEGVNILELRTQTAGSSFGAHAAWLDPHVIK